MFLVDGEVTDNLPIDDRGLHYGDGCFTTAKVQAGEIANLAGHARRMQQNCTVLLITSVDWDLWLLEFTQLAKQVVDGVIKAIITRGSSMRGYSFAHIGSPRRIFMTAALPNYQLQRERGIQLVLSPIRLAINPLLAGVKHLNRLEQVLIKHYVEQQGSDEAVVVDTQGDLVECCSANLFWRQGEQVYTPKLQGAGVEGLMRQRIIAALHGSSYQLHQVTVPMNALYTADELLICNSLMPFLPVNALKVEQDYPYNSRQLFSYLSQHCLD